MIAAPTGVLFVCRVCGRTSPTAGGEAVGDVVATEGWSDHCWATSVALPETWLVRTRLGRVWAYRDPTRGVVDKPQ